MTNEDFSHCTRNQSVWCVSSGLPGHDGSVSDVSSCGGVPHSRQPRGNVGEAPDGWWEKKHMPIHQEDTFFFQSVVVFDLIRCICQWQITHCLLPHTHTGRHCLCTGQLHDLTSADASLADYFFHIAKLNQLLVLSQQLEEDMRHLGSHKYIAHQLSVIYVRRMNLPFVFLFLLHFMLPFHRKVAEGILNRLSLSFAASHQLIRGNSGLLWDKERYRGQLQTDETVSREGRGLQAWASAGCSLHQLVSYKRRANVQLTETI